jgi:hypothetical protein
MMERTWKPATAVSLAAVVVVALGMVVLTGCLGRQSRIAAASWDPDTAADDAMTQLDKDGDGQLSAEELDAAPGLKYCVKQLDADENGKLSRQEVYDRIKLYQDLKVGLADFSCQVFYKKKPLANATLRLVPEPFLGAVVKSAVGTSMRGGQVRVITEGEDNPGAPIGMFRVEITSPDVKIPAKYNTETTLGVEVSPVTNPYQSGPITFDLKD